MKFANAVLMFLAVPSLYAQDARRPIRETFPDPISLSNWPDTFPTFPVGSRRNERQTQSTRHVSVSELLVPSKAAKEMQRSEKAFQAGDVHASKQHLQKAIEIYPDFVLAHHAL